MDMNCAIAFFWVTVYAGGMIVSDGDLADELQS
jgi:hypothetical protein